MFKLKIPKFYIAIFLILVIAIFLRLYNLQNSFVFAGDEEHQAILAQSLIKDFHIIWIGVNAAHLGFYLGPYWAYFTAFWLFLSNGNPLITGYISSFIGILTTLLIILIGDKLFNRFTGLTAGLLYATTPLNVFLDQKYWNPTPIPLLSLILLYSLYRSKQNSKYVIIFSLSYGLVFHTHLALIPIILVAIFWFFKQKIKLSKTIIFLSLFAFLLMLAPLIAFDYFHKGSNITTPLRYREISDDYRNKINPSHHFEALFQVLGRIWYIKSPSNNSDEIITSCTQASRIGGPKTDSITQRYNPNFFLSFSGLIILLLFLISSKTWKNGNFYLLALFILTIMTFFLLFPGGAFEYYLLGIFPLLMFLPGIIGIYLNKIRPLMLLSTLILVVLGINTILTNKPDFGLGEKLNLIKQVTSIIKNSPFEIKQTGLCHFYEGWRYLFIVNGYTPERSDSDQGLGWLYSKEITNNKTDYTIILSESRIPVDFNTEKAVQIHSGGFTAYVFKNN